MPSNVSEEITYRPELQQLQFGMDKWFHPTHKITTAGYIVTCIQFSSRTHAM